MLDVSNLIIGTNTTYIYIYNLFFQLLLFLLDEIHTKKNGYIKTTIN